MNDMDFKDHKKTLRSLYLFSLITLLFILDNGSCISFYA
jgi:hypothetical protein